MMRYSFRTLMATLREAGQAIAVLIGLGIVLFYVGAHVESPWNDILNALGSTLWSCPGLMDTEFRLLSLA